MKRKYEEDKLSLPVKDLLCPPKKKKKHFQTDMRIYIKPRVPQIFDNITNDTIYRNITPPQDHKQPRDQWSNEKEENSEFNPVPEVGKPTQQRDAPIPPNTGVGTAKLAQGLATSNLDIFVINQTIGPKVNGKNRGYHKYGS